MNKTRCGWLRYLNWLMDADRRLFLGIPLLLMMLVACSKDEDVTPSLEDGKSTVVYDLAGDTDASIGDGADGKEQRPFYTFLFRFSDKRQIWIRTAADSAQWLQTNDWDIAFTGSYNSELYLNNANYQFNPGYGGPATNTAVMKYDQTYASVTTAPPDEEFDASEITKIGWASSGSTDGWFNYSLSTHLVTPIRNRVYVLRLPDGKYAKLEVLSPYQGNPPTVTDANWPAPYFTFRYYVQQDGSKDLNTN